MDNQEDIKEEDTNFWDICPNCGAEAVINGLCTECGYIS